MSTWTESSGFPKYSGANILSIFRFMYFVSAFIWLIMSFINEEISMALRRKKNEHGSFNSNYPWNFQTIANCSIPEILIDAFDTSESNGDGYSYPCTILLPIKYLSICQLNSRKYLKILICIALLVTLSIFSHGLLAIVFCLLWFFFSKTFLTPCLFIFSHWFMGFL